MTNEYLDTRTSFEPHPQLKGEVEEYILDPCSPEKKVTIGGDFSDDLR